MGDVDDTKIDDDAIRLVEAGSIVIRVAMHRASSPQGTLVVLTGRTEFIEKYDDVVRTALEEGLNAVVFDWRGQGASSRLLPTPHKGHVASFDDYVLDLDLVMAEVAREGLVQPYLMLAHSMGGHVALRFLNRSPAVFSGALLMAPMVEIEFASPPKWIAKLIAEAAVNFGFGSHYAYGQKPFDIERQVFDDNRLTTDPGRYQKFVDLMRKYPDLVLGGVTYAWLAAAFRSTAKLERPDFIADITTPIWLCQMTADDVVSNSAQDRLVSRLPHGRLIRFEGAKHEILLETDALRSRFFELFREFVSSMLENRDGKGSPTAV